MGPESLLIPEGDAAKNAGEKLASMPILWAGAILHERHQLLTTIPDDVYIDMKNKKSIVSVKAKPAFRVVLGVTVAVIGGVDDSGELAATPAGLSRRRRSAGDHLQRSRNVLPGASSLVATRRRPQNARSAQHR
ncbi:MAG: hypothetical protein J4N66_03395 [Chloroflexi bacterium]|nr:hypothetical protein [Chloroflexota bacterium]